MLKLQYEIYYRVQILKIRSTYKMTQPALFHKSICLNPNCPSQAQRVFSQSNKLIHQKCQNWIVDHNIVSEFIQIEQTNFDQSNIENTLFFKELGIKSVSKIMKLKQWPMQLQKIFEEMKYRICCQINELKKTKIAQFNKIYLQAISVSQQIRKISSQNILNTSQQDMKNLMMSFNTIQKYGCLNLLQSQRIKVYFQRNISQFIFNTGQLIQSFGTNSWNIQQNVRRSGLTKANQYFSDPQIIVNDKIQKITTALDTQMIKASYDNQLKLFTAYCWLCNTMCSSTKQDNNKSRCLQNLLIHLVQSHSKVIYLSIMNRMLKYQVEQIKLRDFVFKVSTQRIKQIYVIDRQNAGIVQKPLSMPKDKLWVQVVNKDNRNLAKSLYIVADSKRKDASDILITMLIYQLQKLNIDKITLVTKDHFGITLVQILGNSGDRMQCIEPKEFAIMIQNMNKSITKDSKSGLMINQK